MIESRRAIVRPRVYSPITGEALLLEDLVADGARQAQRVPIQIVGGPGSGKTSALRHLRAVLAESIAADVIYLDEPAAQEQIAALVPKTVVFTAREALPTSENCLTLRLAAWDEDDVLEYMLGLHKSRCGTILAELRQSGGAWQFQGIPELLTITLDALAGHRANLPLLKALRVAFMEKVSGADMVHAAGQYGLACVLPDVDVAAKSRNVLSRAENAAAGRGK